MVPEGRIIVSYFNKKGQCEMKYFSGNFVFPQNTETRCFTGDEAMGLWLVHNGNNIDLDRKND
jgi:hypothetical protein